MNDHTPPPEGSGARTPIAALPIDAGSRQRYAGLVTAFTATTFLSALLLFSVQPMFAKMVLPVLGGSPSVWAVAVFFFQMALLVGYCYAHVLNSRVPIGSAGYVHLGLCAIAVICLPLGLPAYFGEPPPGEPYLWQIGLFAVAIGLPFVAVSANAPLLQAWFARSGHPDGRDPYFMYAASNLGSLIALLGYPLVLEPAFGLRQLSVIWTGGYVLLIAALAGCYWLTRRAPEAAAPSGAVSGSSLSDATAATGPTWVQRLGWVGLAIVPSALLTAFTTHVTTDVASAPLLWVIPLALYLLTFVLVFRERSIIPMRLLLILHLVAVIVALFQLAQARQPGWIWSSSIGVSVFFLASMVAHRTLYESRPPARYLTEFYLWMSLGGAIGGLFAALIAPKLFSEVFEYPLLLALSMACRPGALDPLVRGARLLTSRLSRRRPAETGTDIKDGSDGAKAPAGTVAIANELMVLWLIMASGLLAILWLPYAVKQFDIDVTEWRVWVPGTTRSFGGYEVTTYVVLLFIALMLVFYRQPPRQLVMGLLMFAAVVLLPSSVRRGDAQRSYFGVYRVQDSGEYNLLTHGTTLHGAQRVRDKDGTPVVDLTPATYYHPKSPMARSVELVRAGLEAEGKTGRYGVIGLGSGSLTCFAKPDESWRIFEIDPVIVGIATSGENFTFVPSCLPSPDIVIGDARLTLAKEPDQTFDLIIVDAFSSDAVPVHLMTAEALRLYKNKLTPTGVVLLHISNRYLDLDSVLGATAPLVPELKGFIVSDDESFDTYEGSTSTVAVFSKSDQALEPFKTIAEMAELDAKGLKAWTDDYSDILGPFLSRRSGN